MGVALMDVHLLGVVLMVVSVIGVSLIGMALISVALMDVHLIGVSLRRGSHQCGSHERRNILSQVGVLFVAAASSTAATPGAPSRNPGWSVAWLSISKFRQPRRKSEE